MFKLKLKYKFRNLSIKNKITILIALIFFVVFIINVSYFPAHEEEQITEFIRSKAQNTMQILSSTVSLALDEQNYEYANNLFSILRNDSSIVYIGLLDESGLIINVSSVQDINLPELNTFTSNNFFEENNILHTSRKIRIEEGIYGHLVIGFSVAERDLQISKVWQRGLWVNIGILFFTILFYMYLNRIITKPLIKFVKTIKHIEQTKDYSQVIEAKNTDEIGILVDAFNTLNGKVYSQTEELLKSRAQLSAILETIGEGAITINENGKIILVNQECLDIFGYKREELIGKDLTILFPEKYRSRHIESLNNYRKTGISTMMGQRVELEGIRSDKIIFPLEFKIVETKVENKQFFTGSIRDITERKRSEEAIKESEIRLRKLNATKDKFFSIISHDLRTPFQALLSISEFFVNDIDNMTKQEIIDFASDLNQSAESLYELLNNLLDWSRVQTGEMKYEPGEIHLKRSIDKVVHLLTANAHYKRISLTTNISEDLIVYADQNMLHSVVQNLVSNAIKFTNEGGEIKVISDMKDEYTEVAISDNGVGMDKDTLEKLFRLDTQVTFLGTKNEKGTGLGLILCKELVEKCGGKIWVESELNKGSTFHFTLKIRNSFHRN